MLCPNCKRKIEGNPEFCPDCGIDLTLVKPTATEADPVVLVEEPTNTVSMPSKKKSPLSTIAVVLGLVGGLLTIVAGVIFALIKIGNMIPIINFVVKLIDFIPIRPIIIGLAFLCSVVGLVLGIIGKTKGGSAIGIIVPIIGLILGVAYIVITAIINVILAITAGIGFFATILIEPVIFFITEIIEIIEML